MILKSFVPLSFAFAPSALSASSGEGIEGHYYLSGITEVGSELLLTHDGHFQWMLAYGALDQQAEGSWAIDGKILILTSRPPSNEGVSFKLGESAAWNERATQALRHYRETLAIAKRKLECPLPSLSGEVADDIASVEFGNSQPPVSRIAEQGRASERARQVAQAALDRLKAHPGWKDDSALTGQVDTAVADFMAARSTLIALRDLAGIAPSPPQELDLPQECRLADWRKEIASFRGVAVDVFDRERYQKADGIQIEARYDRGLPVSMVLEEGAAFFPLAAGQRIVALSLHVPGAPGDKDQTFPVSLGRPSIQLIDADLGPMTRPAFPAMRLAINADGSLSPLDLLSRGTYRKAMIVPPAVPSVPSDSGASPKTSATSACDIHRWEDEIGRRERQAVRYPPEASLQKIGGGATIRLDIDRRGVITYVAPESSSGSDPLDGAAMNAVRTIGTLAARPCGAMGAKARIPVAFTITE